MRKRIVPRGSEGIVGPDDNWLDLERLAQVDVTSEDSEYPIDSALVAGSGRFWRASQPGEQRIRLLFDEPLGLRRIYLEFHEEAQERTQEFALRWSPDGGQTYREILRQRYNFSPPGTTCEMEDYKVGLEGVTALELEITPNVSGGDVLASLALLRLA